jgi:hypothetical protein
MVFIFVHFIYLCYRYYICHMTRTPKPAKTFQIEKKESGEK